MRILAIFWALCLLNGWMLVSVRAQELQQTMGAQEPPSSSMLADTQRLEFQSERAVQAPARELGMGMMGGGGGDGGPGYFLLFQPQASVSGQSTELGFLRQQLRIGAPLYKDEQNMLLLNGSVQNHLFQGSAVFPQSGEAFPEQLWNIRLGPTYIRKLNDGWVFGLISTVNIASDAPFEHGRDVNANFISFLKVPVRENDAWLFSIFYSPLSEIAFPIPGIAYQWNPNDEWNINLGVPFSLSYRPGCWSFDFNWMPVRNFRAQAAYQITDALQVYTRYQWANDSWFLESRTEDRDRLFYYEMTLTAGLRYQLADRLFAELGAGYAFDRFFFQGRRFDDRDNERIDLASGLLIQAGVSMRF